MWIIKEHSGVSKDCKKAPKAAVKKYELWKSLVFRHGPAKLKEFPGFHDEKLKARGPAFIAIEFEASSDLRG
jgi:hypothetical protein